MNMQLLQGIVEREFPDIISSTVLGEVNELRIFLNDGSQSALSPSITMMVRKVM